VAISAFALVACDQDGPTAPADNVVNLDFVKAVVPCNQIVVQSSRRSDVNVADIRVEASRTTVRPTATRKCGLRAQFGNEVDVSARIRK